jgi:hypothetical protein
MKTYLTSALICLIVSLGTAQEWSHRMVQFSSSQLFTDAVSTIIDYDNDGLEDILYGNHNLRELFLLRNNEAGILQLELLTDSLYGVLWLHAFEYNNDGLQDLILAASTTQGDEIYLCINQGNENFEWHYMGYAPYEGFQSMFTEDLDDDGDMDVIYDDFANSNVVWLLINNGDDTFIQTYIEYSGQPTRLYDVTDFDLDGDKDLLTAYANFSQGAYILVCEENIGNMEFIRHEGPALPGTTYGVVGNFTNDNLPDFILSSTFGNGDVVMYKNEGACEFSETSVNIPVSLFSYISVTNDYDNDGDDDFFASYNNELKLIKQNANNSFTAQTIVAEQYWGNPTDYLDINHDGQKDLINRTAGIWHHSGNNYERAYLWRNEQISRLLTGQFTPDGNMDIVAASNGGILSFYNQTFDEKLEYFDDQYLSGANITYSTAFRDVVIFDRDSDGDDDLLCGIANYLYWYDVTENSFEQVTVNNNVDGSRLWVGDLDDDGNHDILYHANNLKRWEWNGNNYSSSNLSSEIWPDYCIIDVDNDDDKDILYLDYNINTGEFILTYRVNNNGNFNASEAILILNDYFSNAQSDLGANPPMIPADMDSDGDMDMVFGSTNEDYVAWFRNDGDALFTPIIIYEDFLNFAGLDVGDTDNDGDLDIVVSRGNEESITILYNDGLGAFLPAGIPIYVSAPTNIRIVDMDNDGDNDIVYASQMDYRIGWLENGLNDCPRSYSSEMQIICAEDSLLFGGSYIHNFGVYGDTLLAFSGCDSVHVLTLDVFPINPISVSLSVNTLTASSGFNSYIWTLNGNILPSENSMSIDAADYGTGNYSVAATDDNNCLSSSASLNVNSIVSIAENNNNSIDIWPVPCFNYINIKIEGAGILDVKLLDNMGKMVLQTSNPSSGMIDLSMISSGSYQMVITDTKGNKTVKPLKKV